MHFPRLPLAALRAFEAAARHRSFKHAAGELHVTPAAISHRIKALEAELGLRLFRRHPRGITLTPEGEQYRERIAEAFTLIARATEDLGRPPVDGPLVVSASHAFTQHCLLPRVGSLLERHPGLRLSLIADDRPADLGRGEADLAIRFGTGRCPGLQSEHLLGDAITVVGPAGQRPGEGEWQGARFIEDIGATPAEPWSGWAPWWQALGLHDHAALDRLRVSDSGLALAACRQGLGLCLARFSVAREALRAGWVTSLQPWRPSEFAYYLMSLPGVSHNPRHAAFRSWLGEALSDMARELAAALAGGP